MAKIIDITDKLDLEGNPSIRIKEAEVEVNADAATILKIMGILGEKEEPGPAEILKMYELIFQEEARKKLEGLHMSFTDFKTVLYAAIGLVTGEESQGEQ